uniref:ER membrane protein complex subunit 10 n=1 Tax=Phallusia mammillata TaxID=59560 RepID=A0A6F9DB79_9ASCI|nr:ER membrane protein complex subunit 10 [Phallusia mammillata]
MCNVFYLLVIVSCVWIRATAHESGYSLIVEHAFGEGEFQKRGEILFSNLKGDEASFKNPVQLSPSEVRELEKIAKQDGMYKIRMSTKLQEVSSKTEDSSWVSTFTYANQLLGTDLHHALNIHTDGLGSIISISIVPVPCIDCRHDDTFDFDTNVIVTVPIQAQSPDTAGFLTKIEEEKRKKEKQANEPQSFFGKYWMFIVPVVFFMMVSNAAQQQQ